MKKKLAVGLLVSTLLLSGCQSITKCAVKHLPLGMWHVTEKLENGVDMGVKQND